MPALIPITEDIGAREEKCAICGKVIGVVDFIVRAGYMRGQMRIDYVHLDCDPDVKQHIDELRANRKVKP